MSTASRRSPSRLVLANAVASGGMLVALGAVFVLYDSRLALAQAADSFSDIFTATALLVSMRVAAAPPDEGHPVGHQRAEPIAALIAAVMAGVLAVEVGREAITALVEGASPAMEWPLLMAFGLKIGVKLTIAWLARPARGGASPALRALHVDARNDVIVGILAVVGFFVARDGGGHWDAWLALPVAAWVGWSGIDLARENIRLLMGEAPPPRRQKELLRVAHDVLGVRDAYGLVARHHGVDLDVIVHVAVDPMIRVEEARDIAGAVEKRLLREDDVCHAVVRIEVDPERDGADPSERAR